MQLRLVITITALVIIFLFSAVVLLHWWIKSILTEKTRNYPECTALRLPKKDALQSELGIYKNGAVASDVYECSKLGRQTLEKNGSAVDASIVTTLCSCLYNPHSCGIGGGHLSLIYLKKENKIVFIDAREVAPMKASLSTHTDEYSLKFGGLAIGVPGELYGFWEAHKLGGRLPWKELFGPIIDLCEHGIRVSKFLSYVLPRYETCIKSNEYLTSIFYNKDTKSIVKENEIIRYPLLAATLRTISNTNVLEFYGGDLAKVIVKEINKRDGIFTEDDLKKYKPKIKTPIPIKLKNGYTMFASPPPSSGLLTSLIVQVMTKYNLTENTLNDSNEEVLYYHRLLEAIKFAFGKRVELGDDSFNDMSQIIKQITDDNFINKIFSRINDGQTYGWSYYDNYEDVNNGLGTSHISVLSADGDAVATSTSINLVLGSCVAGEETGIIYNNQMSDFSIPKEKNSSRIHQKNLLEPEKRPLSSMSPVIVFDKNNNVRLVIGASGGLKIFTNVASIIIENLYLGRNIKEAISGFKVHTQPIPDHVQVESLRDIPEHIRSGLEKRGHKLDCNLISSSVAQGIERKENGEIWAYSDGRKGGNPDGY